jgi:hypothetical protein
VGNFLFLIIFESSTDFRGAADPFLHPSESGSFLGKGKSFFEGMRRIRPGEWRGPNLNAEEGGEISAGEKDGVDRNHYS